MLDADYSSMSLHQQAVLHWPLCCDWEAFGRPGGDTEKESLLRFHFQSIVKFF